VEVLIHPQSIVHSLVEFVDGSILAQLSKTDMKIPIQYALTYPERVAANHHFLEPEALRKLEFAPPDRRRFRCLDLAYQALEAGGAATCALNAADEIAVETFLAGRIPFLAIPRVIEETLEKVGARPARTLEEILDCDQQARRVAAKASEQGSAA
jgi:1-deoxy-D-xylulose-5-phosphate reductoisomerase